MKFIIVLLSAGVCLVSAAESRETKCGVPAISPDTSTNIIGGKDVVPYSWPWQAVLEVDRGAGKFSLTCGGTLISNQWVMSAGHCFDPKRKPSDYKIKLGVYDQTKGNEPGEIVSEITEFHVHPKFKGPGLFSPPVYDISLAKLKNPVQFTDHISPVCLPKAGNDLPADGTTTILTGWGRTQNSNQAPANPTLKQVSVPLLSKQACRSFVGGFGDFSDVIVCFGFPQGGKTACNGDSGGPAVYQNNGQWTQIGITSFGKGTQTQPCSGAYSAYSRVATFLDFIHQYVTDL